MAKGYMPPKQAEQVAWSQNFSTIISSSPATFGLTQPQADAFAGINTTLQQAYLRGTTEGTRTKISVAEKNTALKNMKVAARDLVSIIQGQAISAAQKIQLGITVRKDKPTPKPVPSQKPFVKVKKVDGRTVTIELRQDKSKRGKPANVAGATVFTASGDSAPESATDWKFVSNTTRTTLEIPFPPSATGDTVWITAFWNNAKDESGPAAKPVSVNLPAGGVLPSEANEAPVRRAA